MATNVYNYLGSTGWLYRYNDCYLLCPPLGSTLPNGASITNNKIVSPTIYYENQLNQTAGGVVMGNTFRLAVQQSALNNRGLANMGGFTLFIKVATDGNDAVAGNLRESNTAGTAITGNNWPFTLSRGRALCLAMSGTGGAAGGLTGQFTFYIVNKEPQNDDELIWRVQYSFGGTSGNNYPGGSVVQFWDPWEAYTDITTGSTFFSNRDNLAVGYTSSRDAKDGSEPRPTTWPYLP